MFENREMGTMIKSYLNDSNFINKVNNNARWFDGIVNDNAKLIAGCIVDPISLSGIYNKLDQEVYEITAFINHDAISYIKNPREETCTCSIVGDPKSVLKIKNPTDEMYLLALSKDPSIINYIENCSDHVFSVGSVLSNEDETLRLLVQAGISEDDAFEDIRTIKKATQTTKMYFETRRQEIIKKYGLECLL